MVSKGRGMVTKANATQACVPRPKPNTTIIDVDNSATGGLNGEQW